MSARDRYQTAASFRTALEQRLRAEAQASGIPLNRLRKEVAFNRLLARLYRAAPNGWALKGGLALIARLGAGIRGTKDADANWRAARSDLEDTLSLVEKLDLEDWFGFVVGDARPLQGEGAEGALRYSVDARIDGRIFEQMSLDVNVIDPRDARPIELVVVQRNPFEFVGETLLEIPMVTPEQQVIADQVQLPSGARLTDARTHSKCGLPGGRPSSSSRHPTGERPWIGFITDYPLPWNTLNAAFVALTQFLDPVLAGTAADSDAVWQRDLRRWK